MIWSRTQIVRLSLPERGIRPWQRRMPTCKPAHGQVRCLVIPFPHEYERENGGGQAKPNCFYEEATRAKRKLENADRPTKLHEPDFGSQICCAGLGAADAAGLIVHKPIDAPSSFDLHPALDKAPVDDRSWRPLGRGIPVSALRPPPPPFAFRVIRLSSHVSTFTSCGRPKPLQSTRLRGARVGFTAAYAMSSYSL